MIRTTIYLPDELHEDLRKKAFQGRTSMSKLIISALLPKYVSNVKPLTDKELLGKPGHKILPIEPAVTTFYKKAGEIKSDDYV